MQFTNNIFVKPFIAMALLCISATYAGEKAILVQSTTSTANSGLYDYLLPYFENETSIKVNVVAVGTGQAIRNASNCDADVLLVHAKELEEKFVADGFGVQRHNLMYNDFVIVGSTDDPANIEGMADVITAFEKIASTRASFASRGDNSGTHTKEMKLWNETGTDPTVDSGKWYLETGSGMGVTLNIAVTTGAYALTDRATWTNFKNRAQHNVLVQGDDRLFNQYGVTLVSSEKCPETNTVQGAAFVDWLVSERGQTLIANYRVADQQLFYPNAQ